MVKKTTSGEKTPLEEKAEAILVSFQRAIQKYNNAAHLTAIGQDRMCPIFFRDDVFYLALPWADFDNFQQHLLNNRIPVDDVFFTQLFELLPTLKGKVALDVGGYTGLTSMILLRSLNPKHVHIFEPQNTMQDALGAMLDKNGCEDKITLHQKIIGEDGVEMTLGRHRPNSLADTSYIVRKGGPLRSVSIDSLGIKSVGMINLDYAGSKIPAIRGALKTIKKYKPLISVDLTGRDHLEIEEVLSDLNYTKHRVGSHSMFFLP